VIDIMVTSGSGKLRKDRNILEARSRSQWRSQPENLRGAKGWGAKCLILGK